MDSKPLGYDSLKTILQYMEANKRFAMTINSAKYAVRTFIENWKSPDGTIRYEGDKGRFAYDLDRFGLENHSANAAFTTGDLMNKKRRKLDNFQHYWKIRKLERRMNEYKNDHRQRENCEAQLVPYYCSRDRSPLPYDLHIYLEFVHTSSSGYKKVELFSYNRTLPEAMQYLNTKLFGKRKHPIKVKQLENGRHDKTNRLPVDLKIEVRELQAMTMSKAKQLLPVIQNSKLDVFRLEWPSEDDFEIGILKNAQLLILDCSILFNWLPHAQALQNQQVILLCTDYYDLSSDKHRRFIQHWIETGREAGTCFTFGINEHNMKYIKRTVVEQFGALMITMRNQCKLVVSFEEKPLERSKEYCGRWGMRMEVFQ